MTKKPAGKARKTAATVALLVSLLVIVGFVVMLINQTAQLVDLSKLVLEIARTYYQRPTLRDLAYLYSNVAATAFIAGELEDLDITEQIQPILAAVFGSAAGAIPGFGAATTLFMNSVTTGSANAFLTLRVGVITKHYCRSVVLPPKRVIRRTALTEATQMLGGIAMTGTRRVAVALSAATTSSIGGAFESFGDQIRAAGSGIKGMSSAAVDKLRFRRPGPGPDPSGAPDG